MADEWEKDSNGNVVLMPIMAYSSGIAGTMLPALRLKLAPSPTELDGAPISLQVGMTPEQAEHLGQALLSLAEQARARRPVDQTQVVPE